MAAILQLFMPFL